MGNISKRLHRRLAIAATNLPNKAPNRRPNNPLPDDVKSVQTLIDEGLDPVHAAYAYVQQSTSFLRSKYRCCRRCERMPRSSAVRRMNTCPAFRQ